MTYVRPQIPDRIRAVPTRPRAPSPEAMNEDNPPQASVIVISDDSEEEPTPPIESYHRRPAFTYSADDGCLPAWVVDLLKTVPKKKGALSHVSSSLFSLTR